MKRVLIPTDFSDNSWNAIVYAMALYANIPCEFTLLNTYELKSVQLASTLSSQRVGYFYDSVKEESQEGLKMIIDDINNCRTNSAHVFKTFSKQGSFVEVVQNLVTTSVFDMIVIGTKGATGAKELFLGSNAQNLIKGVDHCPVLVIPEESFFKDISELAFATDFERMYYKSEVRPIINLAEYYDARVRMIHVYDDPKLSHVQRYNSNSLEQYFKNIKYDFHVIPDFSTIEKAIQAFCEEFEIDILVMVKYEHSFIERLMREPVIKKISFHTTIPFLIIPADN
ncbi:universal stress protein [Aquimarina sp. D1M17]|uniref:universal stress protein n=1 Tax=Aquimarina acroporae TaxID=2937283 RepID=UPI0020BD9B10|nr:universal stress protein [Aquimarina acroporae]MCK8520948.1 universal stress protein [Aquimarina acroporae]